MAAQMKETRCTGKTQGCALLPKPDTEMSPVPLTVRGQTCRRTGSPQPGQEGAGSLPRCGSSLAPRGEPTKQQVSLLLPDPCLCSFFHRLIPQADKLQCPVCPGSLSHTGFWSVSTRALPKGWGKVMEEKASKHTCVSSTQRGGCAGRTFSRTCQQQNRTRRDWGDGKALCPRLFGTFEYAGGPPPRKIRAIEAVFQGEGAVTQNSILHLCNILQKYLSHTPVVYPLKLQVVGEQKLLSLFLEWKS